MTYINAAEAQSALDTYTQALALVEREFARFEARMKVITDGREALRKLKEEAAEERAAIQQRGARGACGEVSYIVRNARR